MINLKQKDEFGTTIIHIPYLKQSTYNYVKNAKKGNLRILIKEVKKIYKKVIKQNRINDEKECQENGKIKPKYKKQADKEYRKTMMLSNLIDLINNRLKKTE